MAHRRRCQAWRQNQQPRGLPPRLHTLYVVRILARKMTREVRHAACASKLVIAYDGDSETRLLPEAVKIVIVCVYVCKGPTRILPNFGKTLWRYTRTCFSSNACRQQFYVKAHDPDRIMYFY